MKKFGIILTSSITKEIVNNNMVKPLKDIYATKISINENILCAIHQKKLKRVKKLIIDEIRKFKKEKIKTIIFSCSSISSLKNIAVQEGIRIFAIDDFIKKETKSYKKIALLATTNSATKNIHNLFSISQTIEIHLIKEAFDYLLAGNKEKHNKLIANYVRSLPKKFDCVVLAQISMLYAQSDILKEVKIPVISGTNTLINNLLLQNKAEGTKIYDSISYTKRTDKNKLIISGSHGGIPSVKYAIENKVFGAIFNDAGVGKNRAGIAGLSLLTKNKILGITVDSNTAKIGNATDTYKNGKVSYINNIAKNFGVQKNMRVKDLVDFLL